MSDTPEEDVRKSASNLEKACWCLVFLSLMTQVSTEFAFPSYNIALSFWGAYCSFSRNGRAIFGFITFTFFSLILDIVFCSINTGYSPTWQFCLTIFILCMFAKAYTLFAAAYLFASIGGAYSMEMDRSMTESAYYKTLSGSASGSGSGSMHGFGLMGGSGGGGGLGGGGGGGGGGGINGSTGGGYYPPTTLSGGMNMNMNMGMNMGMGGVGVGVGVGGVGAGHGHGHGNGLEEGGRRSMDSHDREQSMPLNNPGRGMF